MLFSSLILKINNILFAMQFTFKNNVLSTRFSVKYAYNHKYRFISGKFSTSKTVHSKMSFLRTSTHEKSKRLKLKVQTLLVKFTLD